MTNEFFDDGQIDAADDTDTPRGRLEVVHSFDDGRMPTGVSVSHTGRIFVNFPKWGDEVPATVVELRPPRAVLGPASPRSVVRASGLTGDDE